MSINFVGLFRVNTKGKLGEISKIMIKGTAQIYQADGVQIMVEF